MAISGGAAERAGGGSCGRRGPRDAISLDELHHELGQTPKAARGDLRRFDASGEAQRCKARHGEVRTRRARGSPTRPRPPVPQPLLGEL